MTDVKYSTVPSIHTSGDELLVNALLRFFANQSNIAQIIRLLAPGSRVTRSLLDWFVTNYVKENTVEYMYKGRFINIRTEYKEQLKRYKKRRSDPFCRGREKFTMKTGVEECPTIETSMRQLCFLRWAIECNVLEYVETHFDEVNSYYENRNRKTHRKRTQKAMRSQPFTLSARRRRTVSLKTGGNNIEDQRNSKNDQRMTVTYYSEPLRVRF